MDGSTGINSLPAVILAQIFQNLHYIERLKIEQVCKKWEFAGKKHSWTNHRIFDNYRSEEWSESKIIKIKPFFERCGNYLQHLTLRRWSPEFVLSFVKMAPNVQHLRLSGVELDDECLKGLAQMVPGLKSLHLGYSPRCYDSVLIEWFKAMTCLEYLCFNDPNRVLFDSYSFVQFPPNLKYLEMYCINDANQILNWVAKGCKNFKGLRLDEIRMNENSFQAISRMKSLTYLAAPLNLISYDIGYVFEALTELRALQIRTLDEMVISAIARHCKKLEHLHISNYGKISTEQHEKILRLTSLPSLCSLTILANRYSKEQMTEIVNRLIAKGNLQYIKMAAPFEDPFESEVLLEMLRRCKNIRSIALDFHEIDADFYSKICQVVDEVDEIESQQSAFAGVTHPIVEVQCKLRDITTPYKWLRFTAAVSPPAVLAKWQYKWLSAGKP
ncbi:hypothetical protein Ddc_13868 [Ditylenchus destructor]|nr:hypothetical protein Ddc_13868 [Ditylenchus destructor]